MKLATQERIDRAEEDWAGDSADKEEAREAMKLCRGVQHELRTSLGLPV